MSGNGFTLDIPDDFFSPLESLPSRASDAVEDIGQEMLSRAESNAPVVSGELHESGYIEREDRGGETRVSIGFSAPHAIFVHEIPEGQGYKFLEKEVREEVMDKGLESALEGGGD